mmetsp:Transcript_17631/g.53981  ORF Transcript_17631/g.53981 Transcript_17631/m.53981 type:complete len:441 (-) Transcript_17631:75-1397(-)
MLDGEDRKEKKKKKKVYSVSRKEIRAVIRYIDSLGDEPSDGEIDSSELEAAFRSARRARATKAMTEIGRKLVQRLLELLAVFELTPEAWFNQCDDSQNGQGDAKVTEVELRANLRDLATMAQRDDLLFSEQELTNLIRFMDPDGNGDLEVHEVKEAVTRAMQGDAANKMEQRASRVMKKLEDFMNKRQMRIIDLFRHFDEDNSGSITLEELQEGLEKLAGPNAHDRAMAKLRQEEAERKAKADEEEKAHIDACIETLNAAKAVNVLNVIDKFEALMRERGMRIKDLFSKSGFDASGDGALDTDELKGALDQVEIEMEHKELKKMIKFVDDSGNGQLEAEELEGCMRRIKQARFYLAEQRKVSADSGSLPSTATLGNLFASDFSTSAMTGMTAGSRYRRYKANFGKPKLVVPSGSMLDDSWLGLFDKRLRRRTKKIDEDTR